MSKFDHIRPYHDYEVQDVLKRVGDHPMVKAMLKFIYPQASEEFIKERLTNCNSIREFQTKIIARGIYNVLSRSSHGLTTSGFDNLQKDTSYLYVSNHRDIILDTSLLNVSLFDYDLTMTASAIGDNLVQKSFLMDLAKINRNFLVQRGLGPREMLKSSMLLSEYIAKNLLEDNRSVWIAQREGRTKDGNDTTQQGVLKMIGLGKGNSTPFEYFRKIKIVPVAMSYEFDPTDMLKMPELMAKHYEEEYIKSTNEDFNSILKGLTGQKKRIHISVGKPLDNELTLINNSGEPLNKQYQQLASVIDKKIHRQYKLWPTNYLAFDLLNKTNKYIDKYTDKEKRQFERRIERRVDKTDPVALNNFLLMYANPVINKEKVNG
ncbi:1-acyl-sn-glycerol-3-phosphate acyltransferase [Pseudofulvibacter geojedonensis]|uniref:1-acyl-sn-glycerol-3-phosphate acyltransferase n=1 Tax=Pseudofulvibacter geojedonensis TaxID=1123758 RepID=A0ABW3I5Q7_9FLAO